MINPTEVIEITATGYLPQFVLGDYKYDNSDFYVSTALLKEMYLIKYTGDYCGSVLNSFKARILQ